VTAPGLPPQTVHIPFEGGPYRMAMGLIAQNPADLLEIDEHYPAEMAERRRLLAANREAVFAAVPGSEAACAEVLARLAAFLPERYPGWFERDGETLRNRLTGETWNVADPPLHPLELAGLLVQEDLCIVRPDADGPVLTAAVLCFPSRWRLHEKIGRPLAEVHTPVPLYGERLARPVDRFMRQLQPGKLVQRLNWSLLDDPALFQPVRKSDVQSNAAFTAENVAGRVFLRVERQTLSALPDSGCVLFGIHVHVYPVARIAARPEIAARLAEAVRALPDPIRRYKNLAGYEAVLLEWLDARSG
jgi:hypothetical protein